MLAASATLVAFAPLVVQDSYDVVRHSVAHAAGQGVPGAWVARSGFVLVGLAVLLEAARSAQAWGAWGRGAHGVYGLGMICLAVVSHRPWYSSRWDPVEDSLHTVAATTVVAAFVVGVLAVAIRRGPRPGPIRVADVVAVGAAVLLTAVALTMPALEGAAQRLLFAVGYAWYGIEAVRLAAPDAPGKYREI
nr:DUF998 domain-containing protein [Isoptericola halotolerans]